MDIMRFLSFSLEKGHFGVTLGQSGETRMQPRDQTKPIWESEYLGEKILYVKLQVEFLHAFSFLQIIF